MLSSLKKVKTEIPFLPMKKKSIIWFHICIPCVLLSCCYDHSFCYLSLVLCGYFIIDQRLERRCKAWVILELHFYLVPDSRKQACWLCKNCIIQRWEGIFTWANLDRTTNVILYFILNGFLFSALQDDMSLCEYFANICN